LTRRSPVRNRALRPAASKRARLIALAERPRVFAQL
jgi:hypothetical protein